MSPQRTSPDSDIDGDHVSSAGSPTSNPDPTPKGSQEVPPESQASEPDQAENPNDELVKEVSQEEERQTPDFIQVASPSWSASTPDNLVMGSFFEVPQSKTSKPDLILGGSEGSAVWDMASNDGANNLFGTTDGSPANAKRATPNDDFDFFGSGGGGGEPSDFFGTSNDDNRIHHLSLF
jgi:hypothetical protein